MKSSLTVRLLSLTCLALALSACGSTGTAVLSNLSADCDRDYDGTISAGITGGQFTGTVKVKCHAKGSLTPGSVIGGPIAREAAPPDPPS
jgi:hypothetical protein